MNNTYLTFEEITSLSELLKKNPESAYVNLGVTFGDGFVWIFKPKNYDRILQSLLDCPSLNDGEKKSSTIKKKLTAAFNDPEFLLKDPNFKTGKLCSAYFNCKMNNCITDTWVFYEVPIKYRGEKFSYYPLVEPVLSLPQKSPSPSQRSDTASPIVFMQQQSSGRGGKRNGGGRGNGRGDQNPTGPKKPLFQGFSSTVDTQNQRAVQNTAEPRKPLFQGFSSSINRDEVTIKSEFLAVAKKESKLLLLSSQKANFIKIIESSIKKTPHTKITCSRETGICSFSRIGEDEKIDTSEYEFCFFHTGRDFGSFGTISESLRNTINGTPIDGNSVKGRPYGYFTKTSECYDFCHKAKTFSLSLSHDEVRTIEERRRGINDNLKSIEREIDDFNSIIKKRDELINEEVRLRKDLQIATTEFIGELGSVKDKNVENMLAIFKDDLFVSQEIDVKVGNKSEKRTFFNELPIMNYKVMSSLFGNFNNLINELDNVLIKIKILGVEYDIDRNGTSQILKSIPNVRNNIISIPVEISSFANHLHVNVIGSNPQISFQLSAEVSSQISKALGTDEDIIECKFVPRYLPENFRSSVFNIGEFLCFQMGIRDLIDEKYDMINYVGNCFLSKYSNILSSFVDHESDPENSKDFFIRESVINTFNITIDGDNINLLISLIETAIENKRSECFEKNCLIVLQLSDSYTVQLRFPEVSDILLQLKSLPKIENKKVVFSDNEREYKIPMDGVKDFFKTLEIHVQSLSLKPKKEVIEEVTLTIERVRQQGQEMNPFERFQGGESKTSIADETASNIEDFGPYLKLRVKKSGKKKFQDDSKSVTSNTTRTTFFKDDLKEYDFSKYDTRYFNEEILIEGYRISGFEAHRLLQNYPNHEKLNFEDGFITINIDKVPITSINMNYILYGLFNEDDLILSNFDDETNLINRKYSVLMVLFKSGVKSFGISTPSGNKIVDLKSELDSINPYVPCKKMEHLISYYNASKARLVSNCMDIVRRIDRTAILAKIIVIETFGEEIFKNIFTGFHTLIEESLSPVCFLNRESVIEGAGLVLNERNKLRRIYSEDIRPFLNKIYEQDFITNGNSSFVNCVGNYIVYSSTTLETDKVTKHKNDPRLVVPSNPLFCTSLMEVEEEEEITYPIYFDLKTDENEPINTQIASFDLQKIMTLMFFDEKNVLFSMINPRYLNCFHQKYSRELILIDLIFQFDEIIKLVWGKIIEFRVRDKIEEIYKWFQLVYDAIINQEINEKKGAEKTPSSKNIPTAKNLTAKVDEKIEELKKILSILGQCRYSGIDFHTDILLTTFIDSFSNIFGEFTKRRVKMIQYVKKLASKFYKVRADRKNGKVRLLQELIYIKELNDDDTIETLINICDTMIKDFTYDEIDSRNILTQNFPKLSLDQKLELYDKFSHIFLAARDESEFKTFIKSFSYYLESYLEEKCYDTYLKSSYTTCMNKVESGAINHLIELQNSIESEHKKMKGLINTKQIASEKLSLIKNGVERKMEGSDFMSIPEIESLIEVKKSSLTVNFLQYVSINNVIVKLYEKRKKSYGSNDDDFNELIQNIKLRLDGIIGKYREVNFLEIKIILSIFIDNLEMYKIRKLNHSSFKKSLENLDDFYSIMNVCVDFVKNYHTLTSEKQKETLNFKLKEYGVNVKSNMAELENLMRDKLPSEQINIRKLFIACKITNNAFELMWKEMQDSRLRICNQNLERLTVYKREDHPRTLGYGDELNFGFSSFLVDEITKNGFKILGQNIFQFLDTFSSGLRVIDSGPGLHLLSDAIEDFLKFLPLCQDGNPVLLEDAFKIFVSSFKRFINFINACGKTVNDIIALDNFNIFVGIINGKMNELKSITSSINFFDELPNPYPVYDNISVNFVRGLLITLNEISLLDNFVDLDIIMNIFSTNCQMVFNRENIDYLLNMIFDFNSCILPFIDEYVDENGVVLNDIEVIEYMKDFNLKTRALYMKPFFQKLNFCLRKYLKKQSEDFDSKFIDMFVVYFEIFNKRFQSLKDLEMYLLNK